MNTFVKFCPGVYVAACETEQQKGDVIDVTTKHDKEIPCKVHNYLGCKASRDNPEVRLHLYSVVRQEGMSYAEKKADKYRTASANSQKKSEEFFEKAEEGREFLSLGEPIKVGHHSEHRHRALIERNWRRIEHGMDASKKAAEQSRRAEYWEEKAGETTLAMPESLEYFSNRLDRAIQLHAELKANPEKRSHSYSLTYAKKSVTELTKKVEMAKRLWG